MYWRIYASRGLNELKWIPTFISGPKQESVPIKHEADWGCLEKITEFEFDFSLLTWLAKD